MKKTVTNEYTLRQLQLISDRLQDLYYGPLWSTREVLLEIGKRVQHLSEDIKEGYYE